MQVGIAVGMTVVAPFLYMFACTSNDNSPTCGLDATVTVNPNAARATPSADVLVTGTVVGAPCGVRGVSVMSTVSATPVLSAYAAWSATIPAAVFDRGTRCSPSADGSAGAAGADATEASAGATALAESGVEVSAEALVISDPGRVDSSKSGHTCVVVQDIVRSVCGAVSLHCLEPADAAAGDRCALPLSAAYPMTVGIFGDTIALGRQVTWTSANSLVKLVPSSGTLRSTSTAEQVTCSTLCDRPATSCPSISAATAVGVDGGLDFISVSVDGYQGPTTDLPVIVQGPARLSLSAMQLTRNTVVLLSVANPMAFHQDCLFTLPPGLQVSTTALDGSETLVKACPLSGATEPPCLAPSSLDDISQTYALAFKPGISDEAAAAANLGTPQQVTAVCTDRFGQSATASLGTAWLGTGGAGP